MSLEEFKQKYLITDGELLSLYIEYSNTANLKKSDVVVLNLNVRQILSKNKFKTAFITLRFQNVSEFYFYDTFNSKTISQSLLTKTSLGDFYLSLDPFNEEQPSEGDNMVIKSQSLVLIDKNNVEYYLI